MAEVEGLKDLLGDLGDDQSTIDEESEEAEIDSTEGQGQEQDDPVRRV